MRAPICALTPEVPDEMLLTPRDVAEILGCERTKASELLATAKIPGAFRVGVQYRIEARHVRAYIKADTLPKNRGIYDLEQRRRNHGA